MKQAKSQKTSPKNSATNSNASGINGVEYTYKNEVWVVEDFARACKLFSHLDVSNVEALHALAESRKDFERPWGMVRRLCGIRPLLVPDGVDVTRMRPMDKAAIAEIFSCEMDEVDLSIHYIQTSWESLFREDDAPEIVERAAEEKKAKAPRSEDDRVRFSMEQLALLELGAFSTKIFDYDQHSPHDRYVEIEWFCDQIDRVRKVFEEPMAREAAHLALQNSLQLRRINDRLVSIDPTDKDFVKLQDVKLSLEATYQKQWEQVCELCPVAAASATRKTSINHLSDIVKAYQQYKSDPENRLRDGVFTDDEIQVLMRQSVQVPDVGYRLGWVLAVNEAKRGLEDPHWARRMSNKQCQIFDASFKYAARKMGEQLKVEVPDLEAEGPEGEYPPLHKEATGGPTDAVFEESAEAAKEDALAVDIPEPPSA